MRSFINALLIVASILIGGRFAGSSQPCRGEDASEASIDAYRAILFAPTRPIFVRLSVQVDGASARDYRERYCRTWFEELDKNKDNLLDEAESAPLATPPGDANAQTAVNWRTFDTTPTDSKLTAEEFVAYANAILGASLETVSSTQTADEAAGLFGQLDSNHDGALTKDELGQARAVLMPFDADDDETISIAELNAAARAAQSTADDASQLAGASLVVIDARNTPATIAERLVRRYDLSPSGSDKTLPADATIEAAELGLTAEAFQPFDRDSNGKLDAAELARLVAELPPQQQFSIDLFDVRRGVPSVKITALSDGQAEIKAASSDSSAMTTNGFQVGIRADRTRSSSGDSRRFYSLRFRLVERDKNGYLDAKEFTALGLPGATFEAVDVDKNNQIVENEVLDFLAKSQTVRMNQLVMRVTDESRPLLKMLDTREDSRLSVRELNSAFEQLQAVDSNKDGRVTRAELATKIAVDFSVKRPAPPPSGMMMAMGPQPRSAVVPRDSGPDWFLRMDRNYDGDVSWREFLGPRKVFDRLDADHDGLLSPSEAEKTD